MANVRDVRRKAVKITLSDGIERELKFTLNALAEIEEKYGSVEAGFAQLDDNKISAVRFILWAGLMWEDESLTEKQVGNLIDVQYLQELMESMGEAFSADLPQADNVVALPGAEDPNA